MFSTPALIFLSGLALLAFVIVSVIVRKRPLMKPLLPAPTLDRSFQSPNFDDRKVERPDFLILHYTGMRSCQAAIDLLCDPNAPKRVSSHYLVDESGKVYQHVDESKRAWHAGESYFDGLTDINSRSIGIEICNPGNRPFVGVQMDAVVDLCAWILERHNIPAKYVLGHSDIAPSRKQDPGHYFNWVRLAASEIGIWPRPTTADYQECAKWNHTTMHEKLIEFGYSRAESFTDVLTAFQRHFNPELFAQNGSRVGNLDLESAARLACLLRMRKAS